MAKETFTPAVCKIRAIGVGGGGCNAINRMVRAEIQGVEFATVNTDVQALMMSEAQNRVQIGEGVVRGLGAGGDPSVGKKSAEESKEELRQLVSGADMVFIAAGMGGGTGTGASPIIAELAREAGALTIAIVTRPFAFEMTRRSQVAQTGIEQLSEKVDAIIVIPNESLLKITNDKVMVDAAFKMADEVLMTGVRAISEVITVPGLINLDFADVRTIMRNAGPCWLSIGHGNGQNRIEEAAKAAITSGLLEMPLEGASGILYVITGSANLTLAEISRAAEVIQPVVSDEANVIFGVTLDPRMDNEVRITLVATGFADIKRSARDQKDKEFQNLIGRLDETELETPAYLRRPITMRKLSSKKH